MDIGVDHHRLQYRLTWQLMFQQARKRENIQKYQKLFIRIRWLIQYCLYWTTESVIKKLVVYELVSYFKAGAPCKFVCRALTRSCRFSVKYRCIRYSKIIKLIGGKPNETLSFDNLFLIEFKILSLHACHSCIYH